MNRHSRKKLIREVEAYLAFFAVTHDFDFCTQEVIARRNSILERMSMYC
jgi:hypothetical protein